MDKLLNGKLIAEKRKKQLEERLQQAKQKIGKMPNLSIILVGENNSSKVYVKNKKKTAEEVGINVNIIELSEGTKKGEVKGIIKALNEDKNIHGILLQLPLPQSFSEDDKFELISLIDPKKDVDGITPFNAGRLLQGYKPLYIAATAKAVYTMLKESSIEIEGKNVVIIGRSIIVGRPLASLLLIYNATVTLTHTKTADLQKHTKDADILVVAAGKAKFIDDKYIKEAAVVVDVGINYEDGKLVGDVDFDKVYPKASFISPVPKGVGPLTIMSLLENTYDALLNNEQ